MSAPGVRRALVPDEAEGDRGRLGARAAELSDAELFRRLRADTAHGADGEGAAYRDALIARLRERLYRFFRSLAASSRIAADEAHDLAEDLAQETVLRVAADAATARAFLASGRARDDTAGADPDAAARVDFSRVRDDPVVYAFSAARNAWTSYLGSGRRRRERRLEPADDPAAPSPWDEMLEEESEAEWERRRQLGERLRAAEAGCVEELASTPPPARAAHDAHTILAELWLWCTHQRGSAAAYYAAAGVTGRNTSRDLSAAERFLRRCLATKGVAAEVVDALCAHVRRRARGAS